MICFILAALIFAVLLSEMFSSHHAVFPTTDSLVKTQLTLGASGLAQLVKRPTSAQVMISRFMDSNLTSGSVLTAQSLLQIPFPSLSLCPSSAHALFLSKINKH